MKRSLLIVILAIILSVFLTSCIKGWKTINGMETMRRPSRYIASLEIIKIVQNYSLKQWLRMSIQQAQKGSVQRR